MCDGKEGVYICEKYAAQWLWRSFMQHGRPELYRVCKNHAISKGYGMKVLQGIHRRVVIGYGYANTPEYSDRIQLEMEIIEGESE